MGKDAKASRKVVAAEKGAASEKLDPEALKQDVLAFASSLGFASAGGSGGNDAFDDFAPERAKQRINSGAKASTRQGQPEGSKANGRARDRKTGPGGKAKEDGVAKGKAGSGDSAGGGDKNKSDDDKPAHKRYVDPRVKERTWNTGAGPRPGEAAEG